jgi:hypothetical protein
MMIFVFYAGLVWYAAVKWRRRWQSFAAVTAGVALVAFFITAHPALTRLTGVRLAGTMIHALLYPYVALLGMVGYFVACLPRSPGEGAKRPCVQCGYDLVGIEEFDKPVCPECGREVPSSRAIAAPPGVRTADAPSDHAGPDRSTMPA